jgi:lipopolysaccharide export system protein LptA
MAITMDIRDGPGQRPAASIGRIGERAKVFAAAQRHSRVVRLLRIAFPLAAGGTLAVYLLTVAASWHLNHGRFKVSGVEITADDLTMKDPTFFDVTKDGRYEVRAKRAVVAFNRNAPAKLIDVSGDLVQTSGTTTKLKAKHGLFDNAKGELELFDGIEIDGSNGLAARLSRAMFYSKEGKIVSAHPVSAVMPTGSVNASAMTMNTKTKLVQFRGAVAVRLVPTAQTTGIGDARQPVDVNSEELDVDDAQKTAHFRGKVVAIQGDTMLQAPYLMIKYEGKASAALASGAKGAAGQEGGRVTFLWVRNGVEITAGNDRRITSEAADFDVVADTALFVGQVVVTQEKNVLKGARLFVDRKAGKSRLEPPGEGGRIAATFYQSAGAQAQRPKSQPAADAVQQTMLGSFKADPNVPMQVEANALDVHEASKKAIFTGNVMAKQGDMLLRTAELTAFYSGQTGLGPAAADAPDKAKGQDKGQVVRLEARHGVVITSKDDQTATAKWANFDVKTNTALLGGGVTVTKPGSIDPLKRNMAEGPLLKIDLTTGEYRFESDAGPAAQPPLPKGPAMSASPPAGSSADAGKAEGRTCPPGKQCLLLYPDQAKNKALDLIKKKAPAANVQ